MAKAGARFRSTSTTRACSTRLKELTGGKGPRSASTRSHEAHATRSLDSMYDRVKQSVMLENDRPHVLREMIYVCRPAGTLSIPGVYSGLVDKIPSAR
jgi:threonine dehydrogenase-like Zn-dependent dehydrogenase